MAKETGVAVAEGSKSTSGKRKRSHSTSTSVDHKKKSRKTKADDPALMDRVKDATKILLPAPSPLLAPAEGKNQRKKRKKKARQSLQASAGDGDGRGGDVIAGASALASSHDEPMASEVANAQFPTQELAGSSATPTATPKEKKKKNKSDKSRSIDEHKIAHLEKQLKAAKEDAQKEAEELKVYKAKVKELEEQVARQSSEAKCTASVGLGSWLTTLCRVEYVLTVVHCKAQTDQRGNSRCRQLQYLLRGI